MSTRTPRRRRGSLASFLVAAGLAGTVALAIAAGAGTARAGEGERKVALELVRLVTPREAYDAMIKQMIDNMLPALQQQSGNLPADVGDRMKKAVHEVIGYDEMIDWTADVWSTRFTVGEMRELIAFYKKPLGKKITRLMPELAGEVGKKIGAIMPQRLPAALKKHGLTP